MFYPARCPVCDSVLGIGTGEICPGCGDRFRYPRGALCCQCGKPVAENETHCTNCQDRAYTYINGRAALLYNSVMQESVARFKYGERREYGKFYGRMLWQEQGEWIRNISPDILVPVPLHHSRYRRRGYNQAAILAKELGSHVGVPVADGLLVRVRKTLPQKDLTWQERERNLQNAFQIDIRMKQLYEDAKCAILIDDIYTTGSTAEMCSRVLYGAGIQKIYVLCLCIGQDS